MSDQIRLLIRSASRHTDEAIEASLDWTVLRLKHQIEKDWPTHPIPMDQRLVYAGKLLKDTSHLREVLRLEDLHQPFIIHLVCRHISPPPSSPATTTTSADGIRKRAQVNPEPSNHDLPATSRASIDQNDTPWMESPYSQNGPPGSEGNSSFDQTLFMQQMYAQYMNQYMQYLQSSGGQFAAAGFQTVAHDQHNQGAPNVLEPLAANAGGHAGNPYAVQGRAPGVAPNPPNVDLNANAGGLGAVENEDEAGLGGGQRDILDWFYVASRVLVLFSIVYFYSSWARFALVAGVSVVIYLYQIGFFGARVPNQAPVQRPVEPPQQQRQENQIQDQAPGAERIREVPGDPIPANPDSYLNLVMTFISAFFSSLIPNDPQVV